MSKLGTQQEVSSDLVHHAQSIAKSPRVGGRTVDVIIPCYNYARFLSKCARSVLSQADVNVRILIIDDASSDDTSEVAQELVASDRRVVFRRHAKNMRNIATYNEGLLEWSTAEYVVLLSADDMLTPRALSRAVSIMDADPNIGLVYGPTLHFANEAELPKTIPQEFTYTKFTGPEWLERRCRAGHNVITSPEVVVRGDVQRAVGGYRPELPHAGDLEMWLRIAAVSDLAYIKNVPQAFYRIHSSNMTKERNSFLDITQRLAAYEMFAQFHADLPNIDRLQESAQRALAREALWFACRAYETNQLEARRAKDFIEFALATYADASRLAEFKALRRRQRLGPRFCSRTQIFAPSAFARKTAKWWDKRAWKQRGA